MRRLVLTLCCVAVLSTAAFAQDDHNDLAPFVQGYALITATDGTSGPFGVPGGLTVYETFGWRSQIPALQASVLPATMTTQAVLFANAGTTLNRNVGVAIANPGFTEAVVTLTLRAANGTLSSLKTIRLAPRQQTARFISDFFSDVPGFSSSFAGTVVLTSDTLVGVVALRFEGENFSTLPVQSLAAVGTPSASQVLLPQFVADGKWATEIIVLNNGGLPLTVKIELYKGDGTPFVTKLNRQSGSSFADLVIPPGGIITFAPRDANGDSDF